MGPDCGGFAPLARFIFSRSGGWNLNSFMQSSASRRNPACGSPRQGLTTGLTANPPQPTMFPELRPAPATSDRDRRPRHYGRRDRARRQRYSRSVIAPADRAARRHLRRRRAPPDERRAAARSLATMAQRNSRVRLPLAAGSGNPACGWRDPAKVRRKTAASRPPPGNS